MPMNDTSVVAAAEDHTREIASNRFVGHAKFAIACISLFNLLACSALVAIVMPSQREIARRVLRDAALVGTFWTFSQLAISILLLYMIIAIGGEVRQRLMFVAIALPISYVIASSSWVILAAVS